LQGVCSLESPGELPQSYWIGQELDWDAAPRPVTLAVELPFWLLTSDASLSVRVRKATFAVTISNNQLAPSHIINDKAEIVHGFRKSKTVMTVESSCNSDVLQALQEQDRWQPAYWYMVAWCSAHIELINAVVGRYRLWSRDPFVHEIAAIHVPTWQVTDQSKSWTIQLSPYASWVQVPTITGPDGRDSSLTLVSKEELASSPGEPLPGENELLDAEGEWERGAYSSAVRRVATSIEVILDHAVRKLCRGLPRGAAQWNSLKDQSFGDKLAFWNDQTARLSEPLLKTLDEIRKTRHSIVHMGKRMTYKDRVTVRRFVDAGRWIFSALAEDDQFVARDNRSIGPRSFGSSRSITLYDSEITAGGVVVYKPSF